MQLTKLTDGPEYHPDHAVAAQLLAADHCNVRIIRLAPGQVLPPHTHGRSDLMLYAAEGVGELDTPNGPQAFPAGSLAHLRGDEELRVRNAGDAGLTLLAFLAPSFPPATTIVEAGRSVR